MNGTPEVAIEQHLGFSPQWSDALLEHLRCSATQEESSLLREFASIQLAIADGRLDDSNALLDHLLAATEGTLHGSDFVYKHLVQCLVAAGRLHDIAEVINRKLHRPGWCEVSFAEAGEIDEPSVVCWIVKNRERSSFKLSRSLYGASGVNRFVSRWLDCIPTLAYYSTSEAYRSGMTLLNLADHGLRPGLVFCDHRAEYHLIPDPDFLASLGYRELRRSFAANRVPWERRLGVAFWRGASVGRYPRGDTDWRKLPRVRLCILSQERPELFDVGLHKIAQVADPGAAAAMMESGLLKSAVPHTEFNKYRYQIDIDGNTNSWSALFIKLLTGSPVLKVTSEVGFRQWYYDLLRPWVNFVPAAPDMSDLIEKVEWLRDHDDRARRIGERGLELAESLSYESETKRCAATFAAGLMQAG